jgi:predicted acylesterase/phospholipase RssA
MESRAARGSTSMKPSATDDGSGARPGSGPDPAATLPRQTDLTIGAAAPVARAVEAPHAEVRFGLVLYGGVSLAIYIYGVVYEFWRLVKASEKRERNAWSDLLDEAQVTASVDIVSGTSAGGINGVLLGKALACGGDLEKVRKIWVDEADLAELLRAQGESAPRSLLSTEHFERLMNDGLADLDPPLEERVRLASVFDLFVSGTRLRPWGRPFRTDLGGTIQTRQYRKGFQLKLRTAGYNPSDETRGYDRNDFVAENNPLLARVARATSAFPAAFEPQLIESQDDPKELLFEDGEPASAYFSDGGILHNKPFTETLDAIFARAADTRVRRWLVSVEPDPEGRAGAPTGVPEVDEVISRSLFGIPRYQSIAGDLERLEAHRRYAVRQSNLLADVDRRLAELLVAAPEPGGWSLTEAGVGPPGVYEIERAAQLSADLAGEIAAAATLPEAGEQTVEEGLAAAVALGAISEPADFSFERRRIYHLLRRLRPMLAGEAPARAEAGRFAQRLWAQFDRVAEILWERFREDETSGQLRRMRSLDRVGLNSAAFELGSLIAAPMAASLDQVREQTRAICVEIDAATGVGAAEAAPPGAGAAEPGAPPRIPFTVAWEHYEIWDAFLVPVDPLLGVARDAVRLARISPEDTSFIDKSPEDKLAGDSLGHFGGFLKREWRKNDILWGRLDAAEQIVRMVGTELSEDRRRAHIESVQREIVARELPEAPADYRAYLEGDYHVGSESLEAVGSRRIATVTVNSGGVLRNMLTGLERAPQRGKILLQAYHWIGRGFGWLLAAVRWPVRTIWGEEQPAIRLGSIVVLATLAWTVVTALLAIFDVIDLDETLWILIGAGVLVFIAWTVLMALAHRVRPAGRFAGVRTFFAGLAPRSRPGAGPPSGER